MKNKSSRKWSNNRKNDKDSGARSIRENKVINKVGKHFIDAWASGKSGLKKKGESNDYINRTS